MDDEKEQETIERSRGNIGSYMSGLVVGGMIGAIAALLYAPRSGEETRTIIRDKSELIRENLSESVEVTRARANQTINELLYKAEDMIDMGKERAIEIQQRGKDILEESKVRMERAVEAAKEPVSPTEMEVHSGSMESPLDEAPGEYPASMDHFS